MDELHANRRFARRLALMAAIQCSVMSGYIPYAGYTCRAEGPQQSQSADHSLRTLLNKGWDNQTSQSKQWRGADTDKKASSSRESQRRTTDRRSLQLNVVKRPDIKTSPEKTAPEKNQLPKLLPLQIEAVKAIQIHPQKQVYLLPKGDLVVPTPRLPKPDAPTLKTLTSSETIDSVIQEQRRKALSRIALDQGFTLLNPDRNKTPSTTEATPSDQSTKNSRFEMPSNQAKKETQSLPATPVKATLAAPVQRPSELTTVHAAKLRDVAQLHLRDASDRLRRGATFSAKRLILKALNNIVQMRDLQDGGNQHARDFQSAMTAIRESKDFRDELGSVNHKAIERLVATHTTDVLKKRDMASVTSLHAMECYLFEAQEKLTSSVQDVAAASQALSLLGQVERSMATASDTHAAATALTFQKVAVAIDPNNTQAQYALGENLHSQGLHSQAYEALSVCVNRRPDRRSYQLMMRVAKRLGDGATANNCLVALRDPKLPSTTPVRRLSAADFATTYRPSNDISRNAPKTVARAESAQKSLEAKPVSSKTKIGTKLRGWISKKLR